MVMLVSVADDDGVAVLAVAPGGHDCAGMPSAYDARAIAVLAPGNDYPVTDAGHASRHQWPGCRTVPVMRSVTGPGLLPALLPCPALRITPPDVRYAPHCPFHGRCQGVLSLTTFSGDVGLASSHGAIASWRRVISPQSYRSAGLPLPPGPRRPHGGVGRARRVSPGRRAGIGRGRNRPA